MEFGGGNQRQRHCIIICHSPCVFLSTNRRTSSRSKERSKSRQSMEAREPLAKKKDKNSRMAATKQLWVKHYMHILRCFFVFSANSPASQSLVMWRRMYRRSTPTTKGKIDLMLAAFQYQTILCTYHTTLYRSISKDDDESSAENEWADTPPSPTFDEW